MRAVGAAVVLGALGASCFDGADALGLPCRSDDDCGQGQRCEQGYCGGPPATATTDGSTSASSGSSSASSSSSDSTADASTGPLPGCGNGIVEGELGEGCDPGSGVDEPGCDADCSEVDCGDGHVNAMAGEECDDANEAMLDDCSPECRTTLFWDDMEDDPALTMRWLPPEIPVYDFAGERFSLDDGWRWGTPDPGAWSSGPYSSSSGTARLITRLIEFPPDPGAGFRYELRLRHRLRFDGNPQDLGGCPEPQTTDGGVVWIMEGDQLRPAGPPPGHPDVIEGSFCIASMEPDNPLYDPLMPRTAYSGITAPAFVDTGFPLPPDVAGTSVHLVFEVGYDCSNCWGDAPPLGAGWTIDEVVVAAFPSPG